METELTKAIKRRLRNFKPAMNSNLRTIRWAENTQNLINQMNEISVRNFEKNE